MVIEYQFGSGRENLLYAAGMLRSAKRIIFSGMGSSFFACAAGAHFLTARGIAASSTDASELLYYGLRAVGEGAVIVLVSRSGETIEALKLIDPLRERGARIVGVTNEGDSSLARRADVALLLNSPADHIVALRTYTGTCASMLILAAEACEEASFRSPLERLPMSMRSWIDECDKASRGWREWLEPARCIYLLGRGASLGSVHEGALLFHEAARTSAIPMSVAQFRHGPVEVVTPEFRAIVFASQPATRDLDRALAQDILALGGFALVAGDMAPPDLPPASHELAPVLEIIPVQFAAVRLAEWRGLPLGKFQFAPLVTTDETGFPRPAR